ncbi:MAG: fibronectin type III domain-containing protein [Thermoplasmatota archaeon]
MSEKWGNQAIFVLTMLLFLSAINVAGESFSPDISDADATSTGPEIEWAGMEPLTSRGVCFIENKGQWSDDIRFLAQTSFGFSAVADDGLRYGLVGEDGGMKVVGYTFTDALDPGIKGLSALPTSYNFIRGNDPSRWVSGAKAYEEVLLQDIWAGIDIRLYSAGTGLKYDIIVGPGADIDPVRFSVEGVDGIETNGADLSVRIGDETIPMESGLLTYQEDPEKPIGSSFKRLGGCEFGFDVDKFDPNMELVIDPLVSGNFIGGFGWEYARDIYLDDEDNQYVTGETTSTDFPTSPGAHDNSYGGNTDAFVIKTDEIGEHLLIATFIGGSRKEVSNSISADDSGNIYIAGYTASFNFPITPGALNGTLNGSGSDGFVLKLNDTGGGLLFSTFVGGSAKDVVTALILANDGDILICGTTESDDVFTTEGSYSFEFTGTRDAFVSRIAPDGSSYGFSMIFGGPAIEECFDIKEFSDGSIAICGNTSSFELPMTSNSFDPNYDELGDIYLARFSGDGKDLISSTFLGGDSEDYAFAIDVDDADNLYVTGHTLSIDFPTTPGTYQEDYNWYWDVYVSKFDRNLSALQYSTLIGADYFETAADIVVDDLGRAHVYGRTASSSYPITWGVLQPEMGGTGDLFVTILDPDGSSLVYSTFVGGHDYDMMGKLSIGNNGAVYICGWTDSGSFPHRTNGFGAYIKGSSDGFSMGFDLALPPSEPYGLEGNFGERSFNVTWKPPVLDYDYQIKRYHVHRWEKDIPGNYKIYRLDGSVMFFDDSNVALGNTYFYSIVAESQAGFSNMSEVLTLEYYELPSAPRNLGLLHDGTVVNISWEPPENIGGSAIMNYSLVKEWEGGNSSILLEAKMDENFHVDGDLVKGVAYTYRVSAFNGYHWGPGIEGEITPLTISSPPRDLKVVSGNGYALLEWQPPSDLGGSDIAGYHIYRGVARGNETLMTTLSGKNTTFNDTTAANGLFYTYFVRCANGFGISGPSNNADALPLGPPYPPWKITAEEADLGIMISWEPPFSDGGSPIHTYRIFRSQPDVDPYMLFELDGSAFSYLDRGIEPNSIYLYYVVAISDLGESDPSETVQVVLEGYPTPPRDLVLKRGNHFVNLEWSPPADTGFSDIRSYRIYRMDEGGPFTRLVQVQASFLSYNDTTVVNGQLYFYRVTAVNDKGESRPSPEDSAMPVGIPTHPVNLVANSRKESIDLSWSPPSDDGGVDIVKYLIFRGPDPGNMTLLLELHHSFTTYRDEDVVMGLSYYYYVTAFNGLYHSPKSLLVKGVPKSYPGPPSNFSVVLEQGRSLVRWGEPENTGGADILHYHIYKKAGVGNFELLAKVSGSVRIFEDTDVEEPGTYSYYVLAENEIGEGPRTDFRSIEVTEEESVDEGLWGTFQTVAIALLALSFLIMLIVVLVVIRRRSRGDIEEGTTDSPDEDPSTEIAPSAGSFPVGSDQEQ